MPTVAYRQCRLCHREMEAGEPYWEHHAGAFIGTLTYCEECMRGSVDRMRQGVKAALTHLIDAAAVLDGQAEATSEVKGKRSAP